MKPWYKSPSLYLTLLATLLGSVAAMQGLPGSVTQIAGLLGAIIAPMALAAQRTVLAHQDSAEAHALQMVASLAVIVPDAGGAKTDPTVKPATGVATGVASAAKGILLCLLASSMMSCTGYVAHVRQPAAGPVTAQAVVVPTDAQCASWLNKTEIAAIAQSILSACAGGTGISAAFPDSIGGREALGITAVVCGLADIGVTVWRNQDTNDLQTYCNVTPVTP